MVLNRKKRDALLEELDEIIAAAIEEIDYKEYKVDDSEKEFNDKLVALIVSSNLNPLKAIEVMADVLADLAAAGYVAYRRNGDDYE